MKFINGTLLPAQVKMVVEIDELITVWRKYEFPALPGILEAEQVLPILLSIRPIGYLERDLKIVLNELVLNMILCQEQLRKEKDFHEEEMFDSLTWVLPRIASLAIRAANLERLRDLFDGFRLWKLGLMPQDFNFEVTRKLREDISEEFKICGVFKSLHMKKEVSIECEGNEGNIFKKKREIVKIQESKNERLIDTEGNYAVLVKVAKALDTGAAGLLHDPDLKKEGKDESSKKMELNNGNKILMKKLKKKESRRRKQAEVPDVEMNNSEVAGVDESLDPCQINLNKKKENQSLTKDGDKDGDKEKSRKNSRNQSKKHLGYERNQQLLPASRIYGDFSQYGGDSILQVNKSRKQKSEKERVVKTKVEELRNLDGTSEINGLVVIETSPTVTIPKIKSLNLS
jgi:hypothetical protein